MCCFSGNHAAPALSRSDGVSRKTLSTIAASPAMRRVALLVESSKVNAGCARAAPTARMAKQTQFAPTSPYTCSRLSGMQGNSPGAFREYPVEMHVSEIDTPALVVDLDKMERNLQRVADYAGQHGLR